jgi:hypothetical protein
MHLSASHLAALSAIFGWTVGKGEEMRCADPLECI